MTQHIQDGISIGITEAEHAAIHDLIEVCNSYDGTDFPVNIEGIPSTSGNGILYYKEGKLVGVAYLLGEDTIELIGTVHPEYRRRGIGRNLLNAARSYCREHNRKDLLLICLGNIAAGEAFAQVVGGIYTISEYHMELAPQFLQSSSSPQEELQLLQATHAESQQLTQLIAQAFDDPEEEIRTWVEGQMHNSRRRFYLISHSQKMIGVISVVETGSGQIDITTFGILQQHRRRGYGLQVLQQMIARLQSEGSHKIGLDVETENSRALTLYESCGFRQTRAENYYRIEF